MITTNLQSRLPLMQRMVESLKKHEGTFAHKIMSVDVFPEGEVSLDWFNGYETEGWQVLHKNVSSRSSMVLNQRQAISRATAELVLYCEDDILINTLPKLTTLQKLFGQPMVRGKRAGFICFNNHVWSRFHENPRHIIDFIHDLNNYITVDGDVFLVKSSVIKDKYFLNFPAAITTKKLFFELEDHAFGHKVGYGIEQALTATWFETGKDTDYEVLISLKPGIIDDLTSGKRLTVLDFYNYANINFWNNDESLHHGITPGRREGCGITENMTGT